MQYTYNRNSFKMKISCDENMIQMQNNEMLKK